MTTFQTIRLALVWAAGGPTAPDLSGIPQDELLAAVRQHRLEARLLARARHEELPLPAGLEDRLAAAHATIVDGVHDQMRLFATVRDAVGEVERGPGIVPVKGFGLYALTNDLEHLSRSADIDVLGADPKDVAAAVEATGGAGYHFHGEEHPYVFAHMDALEVHTRYIVTGIDAALRAQDVDVRRHTGRLELTTPFSITSITYDDLVDQLAPGTGPAEGIEVLRPEIAILIRCAHVYVGYAMQVQPLPWATVRLEELAQMRDYLALDLFDAARFRELHERYDAGLVTDFARRLHLDLFGSDPFAEALGDAPLRDWFPHNLWWDGIGAGFPVDLPWDVENLVGCAQDLDDLARVLGPSHVTLPEGGAVRVSLLDDEADDHAERYVSHGFGGGLGPVRLDLEDTADGLRTTVRVPPVADGRMAAVGWATGTFRYELFYRPLDGSHDFSDYSSTPAEHPPVVRSCERDEQGVTLDVVLPWPALGLAAAPGPRTSLPLVVRVRVQDRPWDDVVGGVVVPLEVSR